MYKFCFFVPETHVEAVKEALFACGAGRIGNYDCCCWQTLGEGQFRAGEGSEPFLGRVGAVEKVAEYKVEMVCSAELIAQAVAALKRSHPYEEPAYEVFKLESF
ncbi:YqfO family protein [Motiliproteus sp. SC1-56]|uniref:YqfO family protein n=1 Tax=Motiliproteus sp. SC1-56 TaxID=2799565 RepID=UPI001A8E4440